MWPFTRRSSAVDKHERANSELWDLLGECQARIKALEREVDDLHEFFRRVRARRGADARHAAAETVETPGGPQNASEGPSSHKAELRRRVRRGFNGSKEAVQER